LTHLLPFMKPVLAALLVLMVGSVPRAALAMQVSPPKGPSQCPDRVAWSGRYDNHSYGFSIVIPANLQGYWNSAACVDATDGCTCMSDHGRIIPLSTERDGPERHIEAYAGFAIEPTLRQETNQHLRSIQQRSRAHGLGVRKRSNTRIAGLNGERMLMRYYDLELKSWRVEEFIELRRDDVEYSLCLDTTQQAYEQDRIVFNAVVASFARTDEKYGEKHRWKEK
jgi:hypothetical protein